MVEALGILLVIQGVGGFVNRVAESSSYSWFVQLHLLPASLHIPASVVMAVVGLLLAGVGARRRGNSTP
ncbi:Myxococcales GC_trans_RRR domain-containing protein [Amycolatopsis arida]|uniref:Myxococcales GC_trans_RRR domain-containing protein n=1 Tax=Amycolatopsis arida TaxID=587909 RepID=A0A1I5ZX56_9PSEU|nr:MYXO-CTERM sorting domain-containing protein [Amycolatopsis arida]TDX89430.1 uncharacterized protein (TIGR03382 family) [Amycolatopsis arida]SFQ60972.1 Myxococcales GC_trans_RRR domain-containing protein [Amycolatopsis arida]